MKSVVSDKGRVTIPKALRDRLGIRTGDILDFEEGDGRLVARKRPPNDPLAAVYGILRLDKTTDELINELRGEPDAVDAPDSKSSN